jgi:hypothetical protein
MSSRTVIAALGLALVMGACGRTPEGQLRERAQAFYDLKVEGKWKDMYAFLDANTQRRMPRFSYVMMQTVADYLSYAVQEVKVDGESGKIKLKWKYKLIHPAALNVDEGRFAEKVREFEQEDEWVLEDGVWNYLYKPPKPPSQRMQEKGMARMASRDFFEFLQSIQHLPVEERKRKVEEWRQQHPQLAGGIPESTQQVQP